MKRKFLSLWLAFALCAGHFAWGGVGTAAADASDLSNTLVYAGENEDTLNPILNNHGELPGIIFSGLMKYDAKGAPILDLAENVTYDEKEFTYVFKLRKGVKWHDGTPFTANDVVFTYNILAGDETLTASIKSNYEDIAQASAPNAETVVFKLSRYNAAMPDNFTIGILPEHLLKGQDIATAPFNQRPVGTGRYRFVEWDAAGGTITVERNPDYYGKVPNIERVVYKTVAVESAKALMLQSGEADLAWLNANYAQRFRGDPNFKNIDFVTADFRSVAMDFHTDFWKQNDDSIGVLNYAVDKQAIINGVLNRQGSVAWSPIQLNAFGGDKRADIYAYDLAKFAEEMKALGWTKGSDGIYERDGRKFSFTIQVRDYEEERVDIANIVASQLKAAGVDMQIALVTRFDWRAGYNGFLAGYAVEFDPDGAYSNFVTGASQNNMAYSDPQVDELLKRGRHTSKPDERRKIYGDFEVAYARKPGHLLVAYLDGNYVSASGLSGLDARRVLGHHAVGVMWNIEEWTLAR
ncbi:MAG: ABC transporter substrate-binding protein [Synergistaceae bacterium]|jgi:peptide/nickel transport system substrate-binding protein|nr:ABC transporter substrate-binding protein [Synergistaceae bacterium]